LDCQERTARACADGENVVVANTSLTEREILPYLYTAYIFEYTVVFENVDAHQVLHLENKEKAWKKLESALRTSSRASSSQGMPHKNVFLKQFMRFLQNPHPFSEFSTVEEAIIQKELNITTPIGRVSLGGGFLFRGVKNALDKLQTPIPSEWIINCLVRNRFGLHVTLYFHGERKLTPESKKKVKAIQKELSDLKEEDLTFHGIGSASDEERNIAYFLVISSSKISQVLWKHKITTTLHCTVAFSGKDVHGVPKKISTLLPLKK
jgi:hypothetical protein